MDERRFFKHWEMEELTFMFKLAIIILIIWFIFFIMDRYVLKEMEKERYERKKREEKYLRSLNNLQALSELDPIEFEKIVGKLYQANGYKVYMTKKSKDEGIDLYLEKSNKGIVVQCKHHPERNIGVRIVRELHGAMMDKGASKAILVTSGYFSQPAKNYAKGKPIQLIDGQELVEMLMNTFGDNYEVFPPPEKSEKSTFDKEDLVEVDLKDFVPKGRP